MKMLDIWFFLDTNGATMSFDSTWSKWNKIYFYVLYLFMKNEVASNMDSCLIVAMMRSWI